MCCCCRCFRLFRLLCRPHSPTLTVPRSISTPLLSISQVQLSVPYLPSDAPSSLPSGTPRSGMPPWTLHFTSRTPSPAHCGLRTCHALLFSATEETQQAPSQLLSATNIGWLHVGMQRDITTQPSSIVLPVSAVALGQPDGAYWEVLHCNSSPDIAPKDAPLILQPQFGGRSQKVVMDDRGSAA